MSSLTNFLKLFKWDTKTDGSEKFNIDKALNENWDKIEANASDVNTALATKSDKKYANSYLSKAGWYRIAKINRGNSTAYASPIINLHTTWNATAPQGVIFIVTSMGSERKISILSSNTAYQFTKLRITYDKTNRIDYVEAYYKLSNGNKTYVEVLDNHPSVDVVSFEPADDENATEQVSYNITNYDVTSAIGTLSSLPTTDKTSLVNALKELYGNTFAKMKLNGNTYLEKTFDEVMNYNYSSIFTVHGADSVVKGAGFPIGAYAYGLLITLYSYANYAKTQIYIPDGVGSLYVRTRVGGKWKKFDGTVVEPVTTT